MNERSSAANTLQFSHSSGRMKSPRPVRFGKSPRETQQKRLNLPVERGSLTPTELQCTVNNVQNPASKITATGLLSSSYVSSGSCDLPTCQHPATRSAARVKFVQAVMYLHEFWHKRGHSCASRVRVTP